MPLNKKNQRTFHRTLYVGQLESVRLLKRGDNQQQGTVTNYVLYGARKGQIENTGETISKDMNVGHRCTWHIPRIELDRVGVAYLNPLDRFVEVEGDNKGRTWQPEADTIINVKLFEVHVCVECKSVSPRT